MEFHRTKDFQYHLLDLIISLLRAEHQDEISFDIYNPSNKLF